MDDPDAYMSSAFAKTGDDIVLIGSNRNDLGCSRYLRVVHNVVDSPCPAFELSEAVQLVKTLQLIIQNGKPQSVHDVSEGGLFVSLMESALPNALGFQIDAAPEVLRDDAYLFGESQNRVVVSCPPALTQGLLNQINDSGLVGQRIGRVTDGTIQVGDISFGDIDTYKELYQNSLTKRLQKR